MPMTVTTVEFLRAVGEYLLLHRTRLGWNRHDVTKRGGPDGKTVDAIECGSPGRLDSMQRLAAIYGLELIDIFRVVLAIQNEPIAPEAHRIVRKYASTTVEGRQALVAMSMALPDADETPVVLTESPTVPPESPERTDE